MCECCSDLQGARALDNPSQFRDLGYCTLVMFATGLYLHSGDVGLLRART